MSPWSTLRVTATVFLLLSAPAIVLEGQTSTIPSAAGHEPERTTIDMAFGFDATRDEAHVVQPPEVRLEVDGYPLAPDNLILEQVHVYVRHGERAPVGVRLSRGPAPIPEHWMLCKNAQRFRDVVRGLNGGDGGFSSRNVVVERANGSAAEGECFLGELTDIGRQTTHDFGESLRKLYVDRLGFLPDSFRHKSEGYFRSTHVPRTMETLQQVLHGLYPNNKCHPDAIPDVFVRNAKDENLVANTASCIRLHLLQIGFAQAAAKAYNPTLEPLDEKLSRYIEGNPVRLDGKPRASGIMDTVRAAIANGLPVPREFKDKAIVDVIERAVVNEWFRGYETEEVRRLAMGRLLDDLSRKMHHKTSARAKDPTKILIHATHDTALAGLLATLDVFDDQWPAFTASITFELFKKQGNAASSSDGSLPQSLLSTFQARPADDYFVRMRYQNKNLVLPICAPKGKHLPGSPEFCTFATFRDRVKELAPVDYEKECSKDS